MWPRVLSVALGVWLMAAPAVLGYAAPARTSDHIAGPIVASLAVIAMWEVARGLRLLNLGPVLWLLVAPWVLRYDATAWVNSVVVGALIAALVPLGRRVTQRFGGGWRAVVAPRD